jgi:hypothetical protein
VYADWLDEQNDPRAEFIRLRHQHAQIIARINELAAQCDPAWLATVGGPKLKQEDIALRSGRSLWLRELRQSRTYESLLAGTPDDELNQWVMDRARTEALGGAVGQEPYLVSPNVRTRIQEAWHDIPAREYCALPATVCIGQFTSFQPARDKDRHASELVIIWFQDEFAFPIDPAVREQIRAIDWEKHAVDFDH